MAFKFFDKLTALLDDKEDYNVIIEVGKDENKLTFMAHSAVLLYRSSYFNKKLANASQNDNNIKTISKPDIQIRVSILCLELFKQLEIHHIETRASWLHTLFFNLSIQNNQFKLLENYCNEIITKYPNIIFDAEDFNSLPESALVSIIRMDNLQMEEIKIWDKVISMGNQQKSSKLEEWNNEDFIFMALKNTLQNFLPRYFQISGKDIIHKIKPCMEIFNKQLLDDLLQHLIIPNELVKSTILSARMTLILELPSRTQEKFSTIITNKHTAEISSWIDRKDTTTYPLNKIPYEFQLILRDSRDGFDPKIFWNMYHGHSNTVTILKISDTDEILGGFNVKDEKYAVEYICSGDQVNYDICFGKNEILMATQVSNFTQDKESL
ncbi:hypothetical protein Glove_269g30 [Diversispora epigaea]|uniref:BTB domain-containing protein n=1 Tax=Diversispora epigaea TaxID=1348612 RepID=A0A397I632_9GLOM|nr:hypothetical protein Glove_269g30 [Diversispora epigaea]